MNKIIFVVVVALASYAFAGKFIPEKLDCTFYAVLNASFNNLSCGGRLFGKQNGTHFYQRVDLIYNSVTIYSDIQRCDIKNPEGKCLDHSVAVGACTDAYVEGHNQYDNAFEYDSQEMIPCPIGGGDCVQYCNSADMLCLTANSQKNIIGLKNKDKLSGNNYEMILDWKPHTHFGMDKFDLDMCDGTILPRPGSPCPDDPSSSFASSLPTSSVTPKPSSSPSTMVKASSVLVGAALLAAAL